jgi:hypothetical protein
MAIRAFTRLATVLLTGLASALWLMPASAYADTANITGSGQYLRNGLYSGSTVIQVQNQGPDFEERGITEFDLTSVSGTVSSATLALTRSGGSAGTFDLQIFHYADPNGSSWDKGTLLTTVPYTGGDLSVDVTAAVNDALTANTGFVGFNLRKPTQDGQFVNYCNNQPTCPDGLPRLTVQFSPASSHVGPPADENECKDGGWRRFDTPRAFNSQGDCIQFVNTSK